MTQESAIANDSLFPPKPLPDGIHAFSERVHGSLCGGWHPNLMKSLLRPGPAASSLGPVPTTGAVAPGANFFEFQK
jgi:hypothetical protein